MAYTDLATVRRTLAPDGDPTLATPAALSDAELNDKIAEAQARIDAALAPRYPVPFDGLPNTPAVVQEVARDIAAYLALLTYYRSQPVDPNHPVRLAYNDALDILRQAQRGQVDVLAQPGQATVSAADSAAVENPYDGDLFISQDFGLGRALNPLGGEWWP